ncbi:uncharacterized protein N7477_009550 [Penicillium maclennaniae]|uniref:uncharacterized protein n=1 Tax=Penicillium maclennaniae TaxID=1343394 RepID=UPI002540B05A|nr:uncharacterized protein N7477_009550 [Penicillium maclennaniae]KAJ5661934.1 hypothetical protein N7477_009550 [Penicillium maclennaniae]
MTLSTPSMDPAVLIAEESSPAQTFTTFTASTAWTLGTALRTRILSLPDFQRRPALISIALATAPSGGGSLHTLFQCVTESGTIPDNENWVRRKRNTVLRWGLSSWAMRQKVISGVKTSAADVVEAAFVKKYALASGNGGAVADEYAIHGGGGVEGVVAVVVVSGLKQEDDHQVVAETIREVIAQGN